MRREDVLLAGAALAVAVLSFALVRGLRRIVSADSRPTPSIEAAPSGPSSLAKPELANDEEVPPLAVAPTASSVPSSLASIAARTPDPVQGIVWGYLTDRAGRPVGEIGISFSNEVGDEHLARPDSLGAYSIAGLAPGLWWASAWNSRHRSSEESFQIPLAPAPLRKDFVVEDNPRVDVVLLAPDGRPFFEASKDTGITVFELVPVATREPPGERFYEVTGSLNNPFGVGHFWQNGFGGLALPERFWGSIFLDVEPPIHVSLVLRHVVLATQRVETSPGIATFTIDPAEVVRQLGSLRLRVVDARTGAPLPGATADLDDGYLRPGRASDEAGELAFESLLPGRDKLRIRAVGFAMHRATVELEPGIVTDLGTIALEPEVLVSGTVSGPDGEPLAALITIGRLGDDGTLDLDQRWHQTSDATGRFELHGLPAGRHVLQANVDRGSPRHLPDAQLLSANVVADTRSGPVEELAIQLPRPSRVSVRWASGARADFFLRFLDEQGLPRQWGRFYRAAPESYTLPPGRWRLEVVDTAKLVVAERVFDLGDAPLALVVGAESR